MSDEQQKFIDYINLDPYDESRRLVYSDWLEENGMVEESTRQRKFIPAQKWLTSLANKLGLNYHQLLKTASKVYKDDYYRENIIDVLGLDSIDYENNKEKPVHLDIEEFWDMFQIVTGLYVDEDVRKGVRYSCCPEDDAESC